MIRFFALVFAGLILVSQGSSLAATQDRDVGPTVLSISRVIDAETQTITIRGTGSATTSHMTATLTICGWLTCKETEPGGGAPDARNNTAHAEPT